METEQGEGKGINPLIEKVWCVEGVSGAQGADQWVRRRLRLLSRGGGEGKVATVVTLQPRAHTQGHLAS